MGMEGDVISPQDVFLFDFGMGVDENGKFRAASRATGSGEVTEKLADYAPAWGPESCGRSFARRPS